MLAEVHRTLVGRHRISEWRNGIRMESLGQPSAVESTLGRMSLVGAGVTEKAADLLGVELQSRNAINQEIDERFAASLTNKG